MERDANCWRVDFAFVEESVLERIERVYAGDDVVLGLLREHNGLLRLAIVGGALDAIRMDSCCLQVSGGKGEGAVESEERAIELRSRVDARLREAGMFPAYGNIRAIDHHLTLVVESTFAERVAFAGVLLECGANPDARVDGHFALLHRCAISNDVDCARLLIRYGADVSVTDGYESYNTPLIMAARVGNVEMVKCLLAAGADWRMRDAYGLNACDVGKAGGHQAVVEVLSSLD